MTVRSSGAPSSTTIVPFDSGGRVSITRSASALRSSSGATTAISSGGTPPRSKAARIRSPSGVESTTALPASSAAPVSSTGSAHGDARPPRTAIVPDRRGLQQRAPARPQHGDPPEALVAQRARAVVGEVVQAADRRQQLGEHALGPRLADRVGERVGQRVELVEDRGGRAAQVARAPRRGDERPQGLRRTAIHRPETSQAQRPTFPPGGRQRLVRLGSLALRILKRTTRPIVPGADSRTSSVAPVRRRPRISLRRLTFPRAALPTFLRNAQRPEQRSSARPPAWSSRTTSRSTRVVPLGKAVKSKLSRPPTCDARASPPAQSSSILLPGTSRAPGRIAARVSSQSTPATTPSRSKSTTAIAGA